MTAEAKRTHVVLSPREIINLIDYIKKHKPDFNGVGFPVAVEILRAKGYRVCEGEALSRHIKQDDPELFRHVRKRAKDKIEEKQNVLQFDPEKSGFITNTLTRIDVKLDEVIKRMTDIENTIKGEQHGK